MTLSTHSHSLTISVCSRFQGRASVPDSNRACMPPGPAFNWLAAAHSALVILDHALQYRAAQVTRVGGIRVSQSRQRVRSNGNGWEEKDFVEGQLVTTTTDEPPSGPTYVLPSSLLHSNDAWLRQLERAATPQIPLPETVLEQQHFTISATAEARPSAIKPVVPAADVNLSRLDARSSGHPPIPESDILPDEVLLNISPKLVLNSGTCSVAVAGAQA